MYFLVSRALHTRDHSYKSLVEEVSTSLTK